MKVLLINSLYYPNSVGGAEKSIQIIAEQFASLGVQTTIISAGEVSKSFTYNGVKVYQVKCQNIYWPFNRMRNPNRILKIIWHLLDTYNPFYFRKIRKVLIKERPNIVHINNLSLFSPAIISDIKKQRVKIVHTFRDYYAVCLRHTLFNNSICNRLCTQCKLTSRIKIHILRKYVDHFTGISHSILQNHQRFMKLGPNISMIPNPISLKFPPKTNKIKPKRWIIGFIGQIKEEKGIQQVLELLAKHDFENIEMRIFGNDQVTYAAKLKEEYTMFRSSFIGYKKPEEIYSQVHFVIVPSLWLEPFGRTVIEAYSNGIPVIATKNGGLRELVSKKTGFSYSTINELKQIFHQIENLNQDEYQELRSEAFKVSTNYAADKIAKLYLDFYFSLSD